jgi:hypothetical protein
MPCWQTVKSAEIHLEILNPLAIIEHMKQSIEVALHNSSLSLASIYHELRDSNDDHQATMDQVMLAYIEVRRAMEKDHEGKRLGHAEAYRAMTFGEQPNAASN